MPEMDYSKHSPFNQREAEWMDNEVDLSNAISVGESCMARREVLASTVAIATQALRLTYFTALKNETVSQISITTGTTAAAATPTVCRLGVYRVESNGDLTLVASTPNDTTLFAATQTTYTKALSAPFDKVAGQRYAIGVLIVTAVATPNFYGAATLSQNIAAIEPRLSGAVASQTDLPSTVASASVGLSAFSYYVALLP